MIDFIINPVSGNRKGAAVWREVETVLLSRQIAYRAHLTTAQGSAGELVKALLPLRPSLVVAIGGDGTVHEVVNGLASRPADKSCLFGYIPAGSGNDYARGHHIPLRPIEALEYLLAARSMHAIDLLQINGEVAVSSIGTGLDGKVAQLTNQSLYKKWLNRIGLGKAAYILSLFRVLTTYKPGRVQVVVDGQRHELEKVWLTAICNIPQYGGGMRICPAADPADGLADICIVSGISRLQLLVLFPLVYTGKHVRHRAVTFYRGRRISISPQNQLITHLDGELAEHASLSIEVLPKRLYILQK